MFSPSEVEWIIEEFEISIQEFGGGKDHNGTRRTMFGGPIEHRPRLCALLDDERIKGLIGGVLGEGFNYAGGDGNYYAGDTGWHPDGGFGIEFGTADADTDFTRYTFSGGYHLGNALYWGTGYSWMNSDDAGYDRFRSLSMGLMYRRRYFSIGAAARDLNRPKLLGEKLGRTYGLGLALRPGTWRTTLSIDMQKTQGIEGVELRYALEVRPIREFMLRGTVNNDLSFDVRFGVNIGNWGFGTGNTFDNNREAWSGVGYFHFSNAPKTKPLSRRKTFLDLPMRSLKQVLPIAKWDEDVVGILVRIDGSGYGIAQLQEMSDAILDFRESGRVVLCYLSNCSTGDYMVASACDGILIQPSAEVRLIGIRTEHSFLQRRVRHARHSGES
ncbi:Serine protease SPPA, chloroplastic [Geodia barretti]|uniref:Serine protease SPPA, chloroplastic n=1 Tax=Geodia barretti TaxID=519541 RepID=A0AA35R4F7_GEOBA|nr:Serine protease SPPA, chloroplastic [Geodia barretti]